VVKHCGNRDISAGRSVTGLLWDDALPINSFLLSMKLGDQCNLLRLAQSKKNIESNFLWFDKLPFGLPSLVKAEKPMRICNSECPFNPQPLLCSLNSENGAKSKRLVSKSPNPLKAPGSTNPTTSHSEPTTSCVSTCSM
jgi:hypothetical protein